MTPWTPAEVEDLQNLVTPSTWTPAEVGALQELVGKLEGPPGAAGSARIAAALGTERTAEAVKHRAHQLGLEWEGQGEWEGAWTPSEVEDLIVELVRRSRGGGVLRPADWKNIAASLGTERTVLAVKCKAYDLGLEWKGQGGAWMPAEEEELGDLVELVQSIYGGGVLRPADWKIIADSLGTGRTAEAVRQKAYKLGLEWEGKGQGGARTLDEVEDPRELAEELTGPAAQVCHPAAREDAAARRTGHTARAVAHKACEDPAGQARELGSVGKRKKRGSDGQQRQQQHPSKRQEYESLPPEEQEAISAALWRWSLGQSY